MSWDGRPARSENRGTNSEFNFASREVNQTRGIKFKIFQDHVHYNLRKYYFSNMSYSNVE